MSNLNVSLKPLVLVHCRDLKTVELKELHKWHDVTIINEMTLTKKLIEYSGKDVVVVDLRKQKCRDWLNGNVGFLGPNDKMVLVKKSGDTVEDQAFMSKVTHVCKRLNVPKYTGFASKLDLLQNLLGDKISSVVTTKAEKLLKKCLPCFSK